MMILLIPGGIIFAQITPGEEAFVDKIGPVASVADQHKFDDGFYEKIQDLIRDTPNDDDIGVHDGVRYYDVILVVSRDDGDNRDPDAVAQENKDALVKRLALLGAQNIRSAESLSFVTASIPVADIPDFSIHDEVYRLGDGELTVVAETDIARDTINAYPDDLRSKVGSVPDGTGVVVGVVDDGINSIHLNDIITDRIYCPDGCRINNGIITGANQIISWLNDTSATHGTHVAGVLAASGMPNNNGIATGVTLLDAKDAGNNITANNLAHVIDWAFSKGADILNNSYGIEVCGNSGNTSYDLILDEVVDKGVVAVKSAGNRGHPTNSTVVYQSITTPGCSQNIITVGGINDRTPNTTTMYYDSSRGTVGNDHILKPEIVAPAHNIQVLKFTTNSTTHPQNGTSLAAPQVSAASAMLLQLEPTLSPAEVKASLLLGANWTGPIPCTSTQYETNNSNDNCSYARQPSDLQTANNAASLGILNNVGFGILDVANTLNLATPRNAAHNHVVGDYLDSQTTSKQYTFRVTDTNEPVKVILTWMVHPHGGITDQPSRLSPTKANLNFVITPPTGDAIRAQADHQTNEFAVFNPTITGTYTITVSGTGLENLSKPVQNFALASTLSLTPTPTSTNTPPTVTTRTVTINPNQADATIIRLVGADSDGDAISFSLSTPRHGIVTTDEFITKTSSRVLYTPDSTFRNSDTFTVTPQDGSTTGTPQTIVINSESLPTGSRDVSPNSSNIRDWDTLEVTSGFINAEYSQDFTGKNYPITSLYVGSVNMEGVELELETTTGAQYTIAVPPSGTRMIDFATPITVRSITLSADGLDEETPYLIDRGQSNSDPSDRNDVRMFVGYVPSSCDASGASGQSAHTNSCPMPTYDIIIKSEQSIADAARNQSVTSTTNVPINGTLSSLSASVNLTHTYIGDLKLVLTSPDGTEIILHNRSGGTTNDINETYSSSSQTDLAALRNSQIHGNWTLSVGDYAAGDVGVLHQWGLKITYALLPDSTLTPVDPSPPSNTVQAIFSDDFESSLTGKWIETGEGDWVISTSNGQRVPTLPGHLQTNKVLHSDNCDYSCTVTLENPIDLRDYSSATLSFYRFIDSGFDRDEYLKVDLFDGSRWNTVYHWSPNLGGDDHRWHDESYDLSSYLNTSNFKIRFVTQQSSSSEDVQIDDVVISGVRSDTDSTPTNPTPPNTTDFSVYVADTDDREVLVFSKTGAYLDSFVDRRSGGLGKVWDIAFGPDGHMYASDNTNSKIRKYNGATGAPISDSNGWASTAGYPYGLVWNGNTLYVATSMGVERFSSSGTSLGFFGDASRTTSSAGAVPLASAYDVVFCPDNRMYVSDRALGKIAYFTTSSGVYQGEIIGSDTNSINTQRPTGLECASGNILYQSGDDNGRVNKINSSIPSLSSAITSNIDEPYNMDMDAAGNIYVANKDDDNVVKITPSGVSSEFTSGTHGLDDPRGLTIGPRFTSTSGALGQSESIDDSNDSPEFLLMQNGAEINGPLSVLDMPFRVQATDSEGDVITIRVTNDSLPESAISITDHRNGTAVISIDSSAISAGTYVFWVDVYDDADNHEREPYAIVMPESGESTNE